MKRIIAALICLFIAGCAKDMPAKIETQIVKVPVITARVCPKELCREFEAGPLPKFKTDPAHPDWVYLDEEGQKRLRVLIVGLKGRFEALRTWAIAP